jgi:dCMP deaminase
MVRQNNRCSWEKYALQLAYCASIRSEDPFKQVGACALSYDNRVLGVSYNGLKSKTNVKKEFWLDRDKRRPYMIHAEANLLSLFKRDECKIIAITLKPCEDCARLICAWNIPIVIYSEEYNQKIAKETDNIFKFYGVKTKQISLK